MLRHPSVASASGTLLWHPALTSCYDILLRQAEGLRMERPPRQYNLGAGHFGASLFLLRLECAPFNSPLHLSKHSCSSFNSASFSPKVSPRSRCPSHVYFVIFWDGSIAVIFSRDTDFYLVVITADRISMDSDDTGHSFGHASKSRVAQIFLLFFPIHCFSKLLNICCGMR